MLINGIHLLPDPTGALVWPRERLLALSDPLPADPRRQAPAAAELAKRLATVLRRRRPGTVVWLGDALPRALAEERLAGREARLVAELVAAQDWVWVAEALPEGLPGRSVPDYARAGLTFRRTARAGSPVGEVAALPRPQAWVPEAGVPEAGVPEAGVPEAGVPEAWVPEAGGSVQRVARPCFVTDGRRLVLPAFGPQNGAGDNVLSPRLRQLFRRPFTVLALTGGGVRSFTRAQLERLAPDRPAASPD